MIFLFQDLLCAWPRHGRRGCGIGLRGILLPRRRWSSGRGRGSGLLLSVQAADLELRLVFLEDAFVVVFPELLGGVFASDAGEDLLAAYGEGGLLAVLVEEGRWYEGRQTWMLILELGQVVDVLVDDDVEVGWLVVRGHLVGGEGL